MKTMKILQYCNIVNNDYQQDSRVFYSFVRKKSFGQLLDISSRKKKLNSEFSNTEIKKYIDMNTSFQKKKTENDFEKYF